MYEKLVKIAREGADVGGILMLLPTEIITEACNFAKEICRDAMYRNAMDEVSAKRIGKPQNKSGKTQSNDYTETTGKLQNKLDNSLYPDNTDLIDELVEICLHVAPEQTGFLLK